MASCDKTQRSWEHPDLKHGVFTYYLAEGLSGAAKDEDGYVSVLNLFQYASSKTKKYVLREYNEVQVPTFRQGDEMTDFCLAKVDSPAPTPIIPAPAPVVVQRPAPAPVQTTSSEPKPGDRKVEIVNGVEFAFRWCPPGTFLMGSPTSESGLYDNEKQHQVILTKGFWMLETEVTQKQWKAVMGNYPGTFEDDDIPAGEISWNNCQNFCRKCTSLGLSVQLPTEAQWEYACRAGSRGAYAGNLDDMAWYASNFEYKNHPVGTKKPNAWGLYDMHGNVWEWCADYWSDEYPSESVTDPTGPTNGSRRVYRGGCRSSYAESCRSAYRDRDAPDRNDMNRGFRVVRGQ